MAGQMTRLIGFSERNIWIFSQNFSFTPFSRNEVGSEKNIIQTSKRCFWRSGFESPKKQIPMYGDSKEKSHREKYLEFFSKFFVYTLLDPFPTLH